MNTCKWARTTVKKPIVEVSFGSKQYVAPVTIMTLTDWYSQGETLWSLETVCFYSTIHKQCRSTGGFLQAPFPFITWTCILSRSELDVLQTGRLSCESVRNMTSLRGKPFGFKFILSRSVIFIHRAHNYSTQVHLNGLQNVYKTQFGWRDI